jgi:ribosomal protein S18 acetylase RimI-like enzyme
VVKIGAGRAKILWLLSEKGYHFVECSLNFTHNLRNIQLSPRAMIIADSVDYSLMEQGDIEFLYNELRKGLFDSDRVYNDPLFTKEQSAERYINWLSDEMKRNAHIYKLSINNESIGFFAIKETEDGVFYPFLWGIYNAHQKRGFGSSLIYKSLRECAGLGAKTVSTYVSSNNMGIVNLLFSFGFYISAVNYVFVKHMLKQFLRRVRRLRAMIYKSH